MDSRVLPSMETLPPALVVPRWAQPSSPVENESDAAFMAGSALNSLDNLVRSNPVWAGLWRDRLALKCAVSAVRLAGRNEDEAALRDSVLFCAPGDDPGPAGNIYLGYRALAGRAKVIDEDLLHGLAARFELRRDDSLATITGLMGDILQSGRTAPFVAAEIVEKIMDARPDAELLAWWLADWATARMLRWERPVPLLMAERFGSAWRTLGGKGRVRPGETGFARALCLALVQGAAEALRQAGEIERRAARLLEAAPKIRTKGGEPVIHALLDMDAVSGSAPGVKLSRWASRRLFERLESMGAVRELSGRDTFRIYGV